ncbi:MAG: FAD/NAD(P)-binding protein [Proteobacteria bacterium]|nr:FAD/NAD(P)-binding protein [Pseudomonadota bacterium]
MSGRSIAIVGAGFCGTALATELLRRSRGECRVTLIDRTGIGRGVAYARRAFPFLLNVPAGRMSACSAEPQEFLRFAQQRLPGVTAADYLPRALFGDYLQTRLAAAVAGAAAGVTLERVHGEAIALERVPRGGRMQVHLADGGSVVAEAVVLALGNPPPRAPCPPEMVGDNARYVTDPWSIRAPVRPGETILMIGTGLTTADLVLAGHESSGGTATFHALSRRGLMPAAQSGFGAPAEPLAAARLLAAAADSVRALLRVVREHASGGADWRETITTVRELAPQLWRHLEPRERQRFLRHLQPYWDIHRHRLPESTAATLAALRRDGTLRTHAGRLVSLRTRGRRIHARIRPRGSAQTQELVVDRVVNCTGPDFDVRRSGDRLVRALLAQGLMVPDPLGLGISTGPHGALLGRDGRPSTRVFYVGPQLRAAHWESTAVTELRDHVRHLATHLMDHAATPPARLNAAPAHLAAAPP